MKRSVCTGVVVLAVAGSSTRHLRQQAERPVVADHLGRDGRLPRGFADVHFFSGVQRLSSSALLSTLTLDIAIAAPATTGLSAPKAASGMPTTL